MSSSDTDHDPALGPWNTLQCRDNTHLKLQLTELNANGVVAAFDIFLNNEVTDSQALFALGNSENLAVTLNVELESDLRVHVWQNLDAVSNGWTKRVTSVGALTLSNL